MPEASLKLDMIRSDRVWRRGATIAIPFCVCSFFVLAEDVSASEKEPLRECREERDIDRKPLCLLNPLDSRCLILAQDKSKEISGPASSPEKQIVFQAVSAPVVPAAVPDIRKPETEKVSVRPVQRPVSKMVPPAPKPYVYDMEDGKRVCNRKNDKPHKSDKNKSGHMDMECCLDPDEIPNPHCHYPKSKYGKLLKKFR